MKCEASDAAGDLEPSGISSYDSLRSRLGSLLLRDGLEALKFGFEEFGCRPPGINEAGMGPGIGRLFIGSANLGSTSS